MNKVTFDGEVILDIEKIINSNTVKGIEFVSADPGEMDDNIVYLIFGSGDSHICLRYNSLIFQIGEPIQP
jgi:hypothetical protein